jgi:amino acid transporter
MVNYFNSTNLFSQHNFFDLSLYAGLYPLSRIAYSIALDGLLFKKLSFVSNKFKSPTISVLATGFLTGFNINYIRIIILIYFILIAILAAIFNLDQLIEMCSIGTFMAYTLVSICVLILR